VHLHRDAIASLQTRSSEVRSQPLTRLENLTTGAFVSLCIDDHRCRLAEQLDNRVGIDDVSHVVSPDL
jgi:hypothetical protein